MIRPFDDILNPDPRFQALVRGSDLQRLTIEDHYRGLAQVALVSSSVPKNVRTVFERARAAYLYAWFSYELTTLAQAQACAALELALSQLLATRYPSAKYLSLSNCLEKAIADGDFDGLTMDAGEPPCDRIRLMNMKDLLVNVRNEGTRPPRTAAARGFG